jgi:CheY-like chemotaxis protein
LADIPVIVCTAAGRARHHAANLDAIAYFDKPVDPADLLSAIHRACPPSGEGQPAECVS